MKIAQLIVAGVLVTTSAPAAFAQFVKGNEAVKIMPDGKKQVQTPPLPTTGPIRNTKPCDANGACNAGSWHMVETDSGLLECTEAYARPGTCRASSYGSKKLPRLWVVQSAGTWLQCQFPDLGSKCVNMFARPPANLPYDAVQ